MSKIDQKLKLETLALHGGQEPDPTTEPGAKVPVAPAGRPLTPSATVSLNPFRAPTVIE